MALYLTVCTEYELQAQSGFISLSNKSTAGMSILKPMAEWLNASLSVRHATASIPRPVKSDTASRFFEAVLPGARPPRWGPPLATGFGVIPRV